jgi:hypothetical protein
MVKERWAALSVRDHINTRSLVPDILMYDRLVVPTCPPEQSEYARWTTRGWEPNLQEKRLQELGDLAEKVQWDLEHQKIFGTQMENIKDKSETLNLSREIASALTMFILSQEQQKLEADELLQEEDQMAQPADDRLGVLLRDNILVPADVNPEDAFNRAVKLARKDAFQAARRELYAWQEDVILRGQPADAAAARMNELVGQYNGLVKEATEKRDERLMYTVLSAAIPIVSAIVSGGALIPVAATGAVTAVQFVRTENIKFDPGESKPAAMFYEANKALEGNFLDKVRRGAKRFWNR